MIRWYYIPLTLIILAGCTVSKVDETESDNQETFHQSEPIPLDKTNTFIAEKTSGEADIDPLLNKLDLFDAHRDWTAEDKHATKKEFNKLLIGEKLQSKIMADTDAGHVECEVFLIKPETGKIAVRIVCSDKNLAENLQAHLNDD